MVRFVRHAQVENGWARIGLPDVIEWDR